MAPGPNSYRIRTPLHDARARRLSSVAPRYRLRRLAVGIAAGALAVVLLTDCSNVAELFFGVSSAFVAAKFLQEATR